jgi:hypothetical protein
VVGIESADSNQSQDVWVQKSIFSGLTRRKEYLDHTAYHKPGAVGFDHMILLELQSNLDR